MPKEDHGLVVAAASSTLLGQIPKAIGELALMNVCR